MTKIGYACMLEQFHPTDLLDWAERAEAAGFAAGFQVSEHFHPWTPQQGQSAFAFSFMGALGQRTSLDEIYLHNVGRDQAAFIRTFGQKVLPRLRIS
ncbi:MAG: hypothetical protein ACRDHD_08660 [Candidatus Limnocylindria bacterium]